MTTVFKLVCKLLYKGSVMSKMGEIKKIHP